MKAADCAASEFLTASPMQAMTHDRANANVSATSNPPANGTSEVCGRKPSREASTIISAITNTLRTRSATVRPASTAERAIGSERKRSITPLLKSSISPIDVWVAPNAAICSNRPGSSQLRYWPPAAAGIARPTAPPNT